MSTHPCMKFVWPGTPLQCSNRLLSTHVHGVGMLGETSTSHAQCPSPPPCGQTCPPTATPSAASPLPSSTSTEFPSQEVCLPLVDFLEAPDLLQGAIEDVNPAFLDAHDSESDSGMSSSCSNVDEDESDEDQRLSCDSTSLEDMLWPQELLHHPGNLRKWKSRHRE
jgi:hypothetical protein